MRLLYLALGYCLFPIAFVRESWRLLRDPTLRGGLWSRFGIAPAVSPGAIWIHAVSVGEVQAAGPLLAALAERYPARPQVLTTSTATGRRHARRLYADRADIRYLPYDLPGAVARFLTRVQPAVGVILETEVWPTLYRECAKRAVPLLIASARLSAKSVRRYARVRRFVRSVLSSSNVHIAAQTLEDAQRFLGVGADPARTTVVGNIKYDRVPASNLIAGAAALRAELGADRPVWVAGSTHEGEEVAVLQAHARLRRSGAERALLVLAPRHPPRFDGVANLLKQQGWAFQRRSENAAVKPETDVLLLDSLGELVAYYAAADVAFVGGSLVPIGGHNLLEPLSVGCPALTGPSTSNDAATARLLLECGAVQAVADDIMLADTVLSFIVAPQRRQAAAQAGRQVLIDNRGATQRILSQIESLLREDLAESLTGPLRSDPAAR